MAKDKNRRQSNGSGSIYPYRNGFRGEIQWTDKRGNHQRKAFYGKKKIEVKTKLDKFKRQLLLEGDNLKEADALFKEYAEYWLQRKAEELKPASFDRLEITMRKQVLPILGDIPINKITRRDIQNFIDELRDSEENYSYSTIKKAYNAVDSCLKYYYIEADINRRNPCEGIKLPQSKKKSLSEIQFFTKEQSELIEAEASRLHKNGNPVYRYGQGIIFMLNTGVRVGELIALTWDDISFENRTVLINKNAVMVKQTDAKGNRHYVLVNQDSTKTSAGERQLTLCNRAVVALKELKKTGGNSKYVLSTKNGKQARPQNVDRMFHKILVNVGLDGVLSKNHACHALRHTFATRLYESGCDTKAVSEYLGHSSTKITNDIYIHMTSAIGERTVENLNKYLES